MKRDEKNPKEPTVAERQRALAETTDEADGLSAEIADWLVRAHVQRTTEFLELLQVPAGEFVRRLAVRTESSLKTAELLQQLAYVAVLEAAMRAEGKAIEFAIAAGAE